MVVEKQDHRIRVAQQRRERMEAKLLDTVMICYAENVQEGPPTVDEVITRADVSRATFYKYFKSVDAAIDAQGRLLVEEMIEGLRGMMEAEFPGFARLTLAVYLFMLRGAQDRTWAAFVAHGDLLRAGSRLHIGLTLHLTDAKADGDIDYVDIDAARVLAVGPMQEALRVMVTSGPATRDYLEEVMAMTLIGLGATRARAVESVRRVTIFIRGAAPDRLSWWRDPWS